MLKKVKSVAFTGLDCVEVDVEINLSYRGLPSFDIVGLPNKSIEESKHRIKSAIQNSGLEFPHRKITVNLAPADLHKEGSFYDFSIAAGILCAGYAIDSPVNFILFGELSLDGSLRSSRGTFLAGLFASTSKYGGIMIPKNSVPELNLCPNLKIYGFSDLCEFYNHIKGTALITPSCCPRINVNDRMIQTTYTQSFDDIVCQEKAKKMASIMIAGGHHMIVIGSPGVGKTMLAAALPSITPPLTTSESIEVTKIYSSVGKLSPDIPFITEPPLRSPHHSTSYTGMIGGGSFPAPGEITLAHLGILFLDEFCEFPRQVLEVLRQPLEQGYIVISRSRISIKFPAKFTLFAATNPCKCGYKGDSSHLCKCTDSELRAYTSKLSGPILDRIDLITRMNRVPDFISNMKTFNREFSMELVRNRILLARDIQYHRYQGIGSILNRDLTSGLLQKFAPIKSNSEHLLRKATSTYALSARAILQIIKVARTLADMSGSPNITDEHILESIQYKCEGVL